MRIQILLVWCCLSINTLHAAHEIVITRQQMQQLGITLVQVESASSVSTDSLPGRVVIPPQQQRVVSAPYAGLITSLHAALSDDVNKGQTLVKLESPDLIGLQRDFLQALTAAKLAETNFKRDETLYKEGIIAERRFLETTSQHEQSMAALSERKQTLLLAGMDTRAIKQLEKTRQMSSTLKVASPISGTVLEVMANTGQRIVSADPLYLLAKLKPLWLEMKVPVDRLSGISTGTKVETPCPGATAEVVLIGKNVDPASQSVLVRAEVSETDGGSCLHPGQFVQLRLQLASSTANFRVPAAAVTRSGKHDYVFVRIAAGFEPRQIQIVGNQDGFSIVSGGVLNTKEQVAVSGLAAIKAAWMGIGGGE